jgi:CBS-domain-containing membrane protein
MPVKSPARSIDDPPKSLPRWASQAPARIPTPKLIGTTLASITALVCLVLLGELSGHLLLIPPMAASMALVAAAPQLPLSQPRGVIGGQIVSALIGVGAGLISHSILAAAIAGGLAIGTTLWLRMPHSPAAATAVIGTMITGGQVSFVICCAIAGGLLVSFGVLASRLSGTPYPNYWI